MDFNARQKYGFMLGVNPARFFREFKRQGKAFLANSHRLFLLLPGRAASLQLLPQHFLNFLPLPHGQGSLRPIFGCRTKGCGAL